LTAAKLDLKAARKALFSAPLNRFILLASSGIMIIMVQSHWSLRRALKLAGSGADQRPSSGGTTKSRPSALHWNLIA
jgi:hypothetical protein